MRVEVDRDACRLHGQCTIAAPEVFRFDAAGDLVYVADPDESLRGAAEDAMDACPEQAIDVSD
jgi:ferredoxin